MKPRVLMLGWEFPPRVTGGLGVACEGLIGALGDSVDLELWLPEADEEAPQAVMAPVRLAPYECGSGAYGGDLAGRVRAFAEWAAGRADRDAFDLVHAHDWMTIPAAWAIRRKTGCPWIAHLHSLEYDRAGTAHPNWIHQIERTGMMAADRVLVVSRYMAGIACEHYGIPERRLDVIHNGVRPVRAWRAAGARKKVLFVGRMTAQKAPEEFVRMAARVAERFPEVEFAMVGQGELLDAMRDLALGLGLAGRIRFPGFLSPEQVRAEFATASVLVMPSRSEPFGLVALEAAQFGVPSVVSPNCGVREVLPSAFTIEDRGPEDHGTDAVIRLLEDEPLRVRLGEQAKAEAERATWDRAAARVLEIYSEVIR